MTSLTQNASQAIENSANAIDSWAALRSEMGAVSNRLEHVYNNLSNASTNTQAAAGRIMDTDYAAESANATSAQMLTQAGMASLSSIGGPQQLISFFYKNGSDGYGTVYYEYGLLVVLLEKAFMELNRQCRWIRAGRLCRPDVRKKLFLSSSLGPDHKPISSFRSEAVVVPCSTIPGRGNAV